MKQRQRIQRLCPAHIKREVASMKPTRKCVFFASEWESKERFRLL